METFINHISMSKTLQLIHQKIETMRHGLLRVREGTEQQRMQVSTSLYDRHHLNCVFKENDSEGELLNREVVLIQRNDNDYLYVTGHIEDEVKKNCKVVSLRIIKACWFTRKKRGRVAWLQQKYMYESPGYNLKKNHSLFNREVLA